MAGLDFVWTVPPGPNGAALFPSEIAPAQSTGYSLVIWNIGSTTLYYGTDNTVTAETGTAIPGGEFVVLQSSPTPIFAVSDPGVVTDVETHITTAVPAGNIYIGVTPIDPQQPHFNYGSWALIDDGASSEVIYVVAGSVNTITAAVATRFSHAVGTSIKLIEGRDAIVRTIGGSNG